MSRYERSNQNQGVPYSSASTDSWKVKTPNCRDSDDGDASGNAPVRHAETCQYKQTRPKK